MSFCIVSGCRNRRNKKNTEQLDLEKALNKNISFHLFPIDVERRKKWLKAVQLENYEPPKSATVCSVHFKDTDYELNNTKPKLKIDAIPYLLASEIQPATASIEENINNETDKSHEKNINASIEEDNMIDTCSYSGTQMIHRSTSISPDRIINSPIKTQIRRVYTREIAGVKKKLAVSRHKHKKAQKKILTLKTVLKDLQKRNLLRPEESDILQHLDTESGLQI